MRIINLSLKNIRSFGDTLPTLTFAPDKNATIFLGNNGCGKTTILDSIALLINPFISQFPGIPDKMISDTDVHYDRDGRLCDYLEIKAGFTTLEGQSVSETRTRKGLGKAPESDLREIKWQRGLYY